MWIMSRMAERWSRDGRSASELEVEEDDAAAGREVVALVSGNVIVKSGMEGPCRARMGSGVPSCETCTPSFARREDSSEYEYTDADEGGDLTYMSLFKLRYRVHDARAEGWDVSGDTTGA